MLILIIFSIDCNIIEAHIIIIKFNTNSFPKDTILSCLFFSTVYKHFFMYPIDSSIKIIDIGTIKIFYKIQ